MKISLVVLLLAFVGIPTFAVENYIMLTDFPVRKIVVRDDDVLSANSVYTLDNEKRQTILTPKVQNGETRLFLLLSDKEKTIDVKIQDGKLLINEKRGIKVYELDVPEVEKG